MGAGYSRRISATRVGVISDAGRLREVEDGWRSCAERRGNAFLTPEWALAWLRHYGRSRAGGVPSPQAPRRAVRMDADGASPEALLNAQVHRGKPCRPPSSAEGHYRSATDHDTWVYGDGFRLICQRR